MLAVKYDEHGERFRTWREVCALLEEDLFDDGWPVADDIRTMLWLSKVFTKTGLSPTAWVERFLSTAGWAATDRSAHELRCLAKIIEVAGCYDQLNLASLGCFELVARRWQVLMEAHADNPASPDYDAAAYISGAYLEKAVVAPSLRAHVAKEMRAEAEVKTHLGKVRELRGAPKANPAKKNQNQAGS